MTHTVGPGVAEGGPVVLSHAAGALTLIGPHWRLHLLSFGMNWDCTGRSGSTTRTSVEMGRRRGEKGWLLFEERGWLEWSGQKRRMLTSNQATYRLPALSVL